MRARGATDYALIDLRELRLEVEPIRFIESDVVPYDTQIVGHAWARSNRDGSPDRRFKDNYQIPIARYGELRFSTPTGLAEAYQASNCEAALAFGAAFKDLQAALRCQAARPITAVTSVPTLLDVKAGDPANNLPLLPPVQGAHEVTLIAAAVVCAPLVIIGAKTAGQSAPTSRQPVMTEAPIASSRLAANAAAPTPSAIQGQPAPSLPSVSPLSQSLKPAHVEVPRERLTTAQAANVRSGPDRSATSMRIAPVGTSVNVFERQGDWVQVGDAQPWGWIHSSLLKRVP
jgi:hypothetical protein